jgi:hypothetical protein
VGIGRIDIGMTEAQVRARLGRPDFATPRRISFGRRYVELQYDDSHFTVALVGRPGQLRVHSVATLHRTERTREGFGVGTREERLARHFGRRLRCTALPRDPIGGEVGPRTTRSCVLGRGSGAETVFVTALHRRDAFTEIRPAEWRGLARVLEVAVRRGTPPR